MGELENRLPVTKEKLARFEEFYRDAVYMDLFTQHDSNYNDEGALAKSIRSLGILRDLVFYMSFANNYKLKIAKSNSMYTENAISFLNLDSDLSDEEKNEFNITRSNIVQKDNTSAIFSSFQDPFQDPNKRILFLRVFRPLNTTNITYFFTGPHSVKMFDDNRDEFYVVDSSFYADGISMSFPSDSDECFDEIWGKTEPKEYDLFFYCLLAALDGVYGKNEKRFIAKIFRKFNNAAEDEKERLNNFIEEICKHEQKLYELERSTESYAEVKEKLKQTIEDEKSSIKDLASTVMDLFN